MLSHSCHDERTKELLQLIKQEERWIRIYKAELELVSCRNNKNNNNNATTTTTTATTNGNMDEDNIQNDDCLAIILSLQKSSEGLDVKWHDDPIHRIVPRISGIQFTHVAPIINNFNNVPMCFELHATILSAQKEQHSIPLNVCMVVQVEQTKIVHVAVTFPNHSKDHNDELQQMITTEESNNIPLLLRRLVQWAKFHTKRTAVLDKLLNQHHFLIKESPSILSITTSNRNVILLRLSWTWLVNDTHPFGKEELKVLTCYNDETRTTHHHHNVILHPQRLQDLIVCTGSTDTALCVICDAIAQGRIRMCGSNHDVR